MKHAKRIITILIISILTITAVFISYIGIENGAVVFADDVHFMTDQELETAYQAYLQSKGGGLIGNAGARYAYTTGKLLNFITSDSNTTGITTIDELKSQMTWQKQYLENGNGYLSLGITNRGMGLLNLYTQYLMQQHYFGDNVTENQNGMFNDDIDNTVFSGNLITDNDNNTALVWVLSSTPASITNSNNFVVTQGSNYKYTNDNLVNLITDDRGNTVISFPINKLTSTGDISANSVSKTLYKYKYPEITYSKYSFSTSSNTLNNTVVYFKNNTGEKIYTAYPILYRLTTDTFSNDEAHIGSYGYDNEGHTFLYTIEGGRVKAKQDTESGNVNIIFYSNNNNNINVFPTIDADGMLYITPKVNVGLDGEVNYQPYYINEGDNITNIVNNYYTDSGTRDKTITVPSEDPTGGVGGGGSSDGPGGNPPNWENPFPHLSPDGEGGFNFNFTLPDLNIDWNISGLTEKFPFSIPFDFVAFCRVLDAEPETPVLQCDIDLKLVTWHVDYDLHQFDGIASLLRNLEFIAFCIALVIMTRNMIKG